MYGHTYHKKVKPLPTNPASTVRKENKTNRTVLIK